MLSTIVLALVALGGLLVGLVLGMAVIGPRANITYVNTRRPEFYPRLLELASRLDAKDRGTLLKVLDELESEEGARPARRSHRNDDGDGT